MTREAIAKVVSGTDLSEAEMTQVMERITEGQATPAQTSALMIGLRMKGECPDEIAAAAGVMRAKSVKIPVGESCGPLGEGRMSVAKRPSQTRAVLVETVQVRSMFPLPRPLWSRALESKWPSTAIDLSLAAAEALTSSRPSVYAWTLRRNRWQRASTQWGSDFFTPHSFMGPCATSGGPAEKSV